jgi:hypothetical protein
MPPVSSGLDTSVIAAIPSELPLSDSAGLDVETPQTPTAYTDSAQFSPSGFFTEGTTTDLDAAQDFSTVGEPTHSPTPRVPYFLYLIFGCLAVIATSWVVFTIPETSTLEASSKFPFLVVAGIVLFGIGAFIWIPVWLVSRARTTNYKGLLARAFLRAALCTALITFLWVEALVISDMFRMGQLSL